MHGLLSFTQGKHSELHLWP